MNKFLTKTNRRTTTGVAVAIIGSSYLLSRVLGLLRDRLLAAHFGIGPLTDAYAAAFRLPEILFTLLVSGALAVALIPVLTAHWDKGEKEQTWEVASSILNLLSLATIIASVVIFIFAGPLTTLITPGFDIYRHDITVQLTRIMLLTPFLFAISSVIGSIQQAFSRFVFYSLAGIFYNLGIIFGIIFLSPHFSIYGVAWGVVIGTFVQTIVQIFGLAGLGYKYKPSFHFRHKSVIKTIKLMIPRSIDQGIDQLNYTAQTIIGSSLASGSLTAYYYANNLKNVPVVLFGTAFATATFPKLAIKAARDPKERLIEDIVTNTRMVLFLAIPAATIAFLMRGYIVRLLFGFGNPMTANTLGFFAGAIVFQSLFFLITRFYYAFQDTKTPLYTSIAAIFLNIILSIILAKKFGVPGLALAQSLAAAFEAILLLYLLKYKTGSIGFKQIWQGVSRIILANTIMACVIYILVARVLPLYKIDRGFSIIGPKFGIIFVLGVTSYFLPCYMMHLKEAKLFITKIRDSMTKTLNLN